MKLKKKTKKNHWDYGGWNWKKNIQLKNDKKK
jgi:hypothetical protein